MIERRRFAAMGSTAAITVVGGAPRAAIDEAIQRLNVLEQRWSRFIDTSEVATLNRRAGTPVRVSDDTVLLVELACDAWRRTGGRFDPTVLRAVEATGYTAGLDRQTPGAVETPRRTTAVGGCDSIVIDRRRRTVQLPVGGGFDPGGIGKGLAADLVSYELDATGVDGGCVNIGGDLRVWGSGPNGRRWRIGAGDHTFELTDAGVATSGTQRRAWHFDGEAVHHLIDPSTSRPATHGRVAATVVAGSAWRAETYATALIVTPPGAIGDDVARWGVEAFVA